MEWLCRYPLQVGSRYCYSHILYFGFLVLVPTIAFCSLFNIGAIILRPDKYNIFSEFGFYLICWSCKKSFFQLSWVEVTFRCCHLQKCNLNYTKKVMHLTSTEDWHMAKKKQKSQFFKSLKPSKQTKEVRGNWLVFKFGSRGLWFESRWLAKFQIVYLVFDLLSLWKEKKWKNCSPKTWLTSWIVRGAMA